MSTDTIPLGELVEIVGGGTPSRSVPEFWNGGIPWATVKDMTSVELSETQEFISDKGVSTSATRIVPAGSVIMATRMGLGKVAINKIDLAINQDLKALKCNGKLDPKFLLYFLQSKAGYLESQGKGATVKGIKLDLVRSLPVPRLTLPEQRRITAILDKADGIRGKRRQAIDLMNVFLRSVFLEMFGDPLTNPMKWDSGTIDEVAAKQRGAVRCGPFGTQLKVGELVAAGIPLLGIENVLNDQFEQTCTKFLTDEKAEQLNAFEVQAGDVLVTRMGTIGRACVVPPTLGPARISYHLFRVRTDPQRCLPAFLAATISKSGTFQDQLNRLSHGAIMAGLNTSMLREVKFLIPPISKQEEYVRVAKLASATLKTVVRSADSTDKLFNSLSSELFSGATN